MDEPADLEFVRRVFIAFAGRDDFGVREVLKFLDYYWARVGIERIDCCQRRLLPQSLSRGGCLARSPKNTGAVSQLVSSLAKSHPWVRSDLQQRTHAICRRGRPPPVFLQRGEGCRVWDVDGNEYIDYIQGLLPNLLGYAHPEVNAAVARQLAEGHSFSLPHPLEVELAERLTRLIPCAEMVRFGKNGSDVTAGAVRAARACTGRDHIACCGYHGWQDWYIGSTTRNLGVPDAVNSPILSHITICLHWRNC